MRRLRRRALLAQEELAARAGLGVRTIRNLETGRGKARASSLALIADALGLSPTERLRLAAAHDAASHDATSHDGRGSAHGMPGQLPPDVRHFTGRRPELARLDDASLSVVAVEGAAGVGKSALAIRWAQRARPEFPDGQLFVDLRGFSARAPLEPIDALARFLRAFGVPPERVPADVDEASTLYRSQLADRRVLVVLDNAASVEQVRPLLPGGAGCRTVVTGRRGLAGLVALDGAALLTLDVLPAAEAIALLSEILGDDRVAAEPEAVGELVRACSYLPLALRITAAQLATQPDRSIAAHLRALGQDALASLSLPGDTRSAVRTAFDLSYQRLDAVAQRLFRLAGVVALPDLTVDTAAAAAGVIPGQAAPAVATLVGAHLLEPRPGGRYVFHDLMRAYARERSSAVDRPGERAAAQRRVLDLHLRYAAAAAQILYPQVVRLPPPGFTGAAGAGAVFAGAVFAGPAFAGPVFAGRDDAFAWLDAERPALVALVGAAARDGPHEPAWLLADTLRGYFVNRRHLADWAAVANGALAAARTADNPTARAAALLSLADLARCEGRLDQAIEGYREALTEARRQPWSEGCATILGNLGVTYLHSGQLQLAQEHFAESLELDRRDGRRAHEAIKLGNLGGVATMRGRLDEAIG
ncbi:MAG TPA: tetratricopeptide repeat protein, partial [Micromonosporaceae bacterium]|nr:tetratricopeptide repeat protein [Micromonosporaceae bacterium]